MSLGIGELLTKLVLPLSIALALLALSRPATPTDS
jgi:hypothetical protein